jgi:putative Mn2+ efflux pump MntP
VELGWLKIIGIAVGLAMDSSAVAVATGLSLPKVTHRHVFRLAFHFGLFQFLMPVLGWLAGRTVAEHIGAWNNWIAFALLVFVGGKMLWEAWQAKEAHERPDPTRGWTLVTLSVATSLDALAVGLSMAFMRVSILLPSVVIGLVCAGLTALGIVFGERIGPRFGRVADFGGGLVLIAIGIKTLVS